MSAHEQLLAAIGQRRTFAIISHPDAGKTTLTEKLLLYGGAIHLAGSVKARRADRHATSDWMAMEQERGISVTSSVMQFEYDGYVINLLDTPGHEDFSEDTYRTLVAADSAVMLLDNRKGVEERTRQLFAVCKRRRTPIFTFVNKCDRSGADPLTLISDVEADLGIKCHPVTWPIFHSEGGSAGFVFKIQANMDPKHRDRVAFVRIVSGRFDAGMQVLHGRTGKMVRLNAPQTFMARERTAVESAWPGDVVGVMDRRELRIGDSLATEPGVVFANIPRFAPEHFARVILSDPMKRKQLDAGLRQLTEEGAAQVFFTSGTDVTSPTPIVGAVGQLQFDVMMHRLAHEYGVTARLEKINSRYPRWITGSESDLARATRDPARTLLYDSKGQPLLLFENEWRMRWALDHEPGVTFHEVSP
ncbi:GTP-binding protein [bacterium]|nr:GTP-binding protein [bacterium]